MPIGQALADYSWLGNTAPASRQTTNAAVEFTSNASSQARTPTLYLLMLSGRRNLEHYNLRISNLRGLRTPVFHPIGYFIHSQLAYASWEWMKWSMGIDKIVI